MARGRGKHGSDWGVADDVDGKKVNHTADRLDATR